MIKVTCYKEDFKEKLLDGVKDFSKEAKEQLKNKLENLSENEEVLVCIVDENNFVGFSKTTTRTKGFVILDYIYVVPEMRRDKNGSIILVAVTTRAVNRLNLSVIAECEKDNLSGLNFLKARSFVANNEDDEKVYFSRSLLPMYKVHNQQWKLS